MKDKEGYIIYKPMPKYWYGEGKDLESTSNQYLPELTYFTTVPKSLMPKEDAPEPEIKCELIRSLIFVYWTGWTDPSVTKFVYWGGDVDDSMFDRVQLNSNFMYHGPIAAMKVLINMAPDYMNNKFVQITYAEALKRTGNTRLFTPRVF